VVPPVQGDRAAPRRDRENLGVPSRYDVLSLPTVMLFTGGERRETLIGPHSRGRYEKAFAPYLV